MYALLNETTSLILTKITEEKRVQKYLRQINAHDKETYEHSLRVGQLCLDISLELQLVNQDLKLPVYAGLLHDVGKLKIVDSILTKESKLNDTERCTLDQHVRLGYQELEDFGVDDVGKIIVAHHEFNVNSYPRSGDDRRSISRKKERRNSSDKIYNLAQALAISDIFDALTHSRSYKKSYSKQAAKYVLRHQFSGEERFIRKVLLRYKK